MPFEKTITVELGTEKFEFTNPSPRQFAAVGARTAAMRQVDGLGVDAALTGYDSRLYFGLALFEKLLVRADAEDNWPFTNDSNGRPVVDSDKFPPTKTDTVVEVGDKFYDMFFGQKEQKAVNNPDLPPEGVVRIEDVPAPSVG